MKKEFDLNQLTEPLLTWFAAHARILPWREAPTPYRVWVSEIMLQQTRVEAVKPYFERFIGELPTIQALAECPEEKLLKLWEGLGYYNRVRNMQVAAKTVVEKYGGELPADYEELQKLKGIGHYTAGAIASIAYGIEAPAVDGNVLRVITRVTKDESDITKQSVKTEMERRLEQVIPKGQAGSYNQALMELGATVCVPNGQPLCSECPWKELCLAKAENIIDRIPVKSKAKPRRIEKRTVLVIRDGERFVLQKRPEKGLLAGMYEFPNEEGTLSEKEALAIVNEMGLVPVRIQKLSDAKHIFSHVEWHMTGYAIRVAALEEEKERLLFVEPEDTKERYPIPSAFVAYTDYVNVLMGSQKAKMGNYSEPRGNVNSDRSNLFEKG